MTCTFEGCRSGPFCPQFCLIIKSNVLFGPFEAFWRQLIVPEPSEKFREEDVGFLFELYGLDVGFEDFDDIGPLIFLDSSFEGL